MGSCGFVGQIGTFTAMGFTGDVLIKILMIQFILPAVLSYIFYVILKKMGKIHDGDMSLAMK